ncbi:MAG: helix-turn-helix transcriptional regulator [Actinobacteria bacterium]|nr:helix-turn-helix transcriptional regulator [Actinomycetota bacterium]
MGDASEDLQAFARRVRRARRERDLTQEALAARAGLSAKHLSDIERANTDPRLTTVLRLADALGASVHQLLSERRRAADPDRAPRLP